MIGQRSGRKDFINRVTALLHAHISDENFGVSELATAMGMSRSQLHRRMRFKTGKTSSQYIREFRLRKAYALLQQGNHSVSEVAFRVGFRNSTYFHSSFRQCYGITPGELRRRSLAGMVQASSAFAAPDKQEKSSWLSPILLIGGGLAVVCFVLLALVLPQEKASGEVVQNTVERFERSDSDALRHFLQGENLRLRNQPDAHEEAISHYQEAIAHDSTFLEAYLGLSDTYVQCGSYWGELEAREAWGLAKEVLLVALVHLPDHPRLEEQLLSGYFTFERDLPRAEYYYQKHLDSGDTTLLRSKLALDYALKTGRIEESLHRIEQNLSANPSEPMHYLMKAKALLLHGEPAKARSLLNSYSSLFSDNYYFLIESCRLHILLEQYAKATTYLELFEGRFRERPPFVLWARAILHEQTGEREKAEGYLRELEWRYRAATAGSPAWFLGLYYARAGNADEALSWLSRSYELGESEMTWLKEEPWLAPFREAPRYQNLYAAMGFPDLP